MTQLHLRVWNGQLGKPGVVRQIRQMIRYRIRYGECLIVFEAGAKGLKSKTRSKIVKGWPPDKVRFSVLYPSIHA